MNEHLVTFWLFATHWTELDTFDNEEELRDEMELLHRQNLPTKVRQRTRKDGGEERSEEHTSELQSRFISYAVFCLKKKTIQRINIIGSREGSSRKPMDTKPNVVVA